MRRVFNDPLVVSVLSFGHWKIGGETPVERLLGKELGVLASSTEDAMLEQVPTTVTNWLQLWPRSALSSLPMDVNGYQTCDQ